MFSGSQDRSTAAAPAVAPVPAKLQPGRRTTQAFQLVADHFWKAIEIVLRRRGTQTLRYLTSTDSHTFAFAVAANAVLSFFPFVVLMMVFTRRLDHFIGKHFHIAHYTALNSIVVDLLRDYLPVAQKFVTDNLQELARAKQGVQVASVVMLLITSTGVFLPLEVALNRIWGFTKNRSYLGNQAVSLGLAFICGLLAFVSIALTAGNQTLLHTVTFGWDGWPVQALGYAVMKIFAILTSIAVFFLIYWLLPHGKVPPRAVAPAAFITGVVWELSKYLYIRSLPLLDFQAVYGPFSTSVTLIFWAFLSGLILLAGAHLSAGGVEPPQQEDEIDG